MALYDHRVFRVGSEWWVAEVHGASGAGYSGRPTMTTERVWFQSLEDESRGRTATIPPDWLHRLSHAAVRELLERAESIDHGLDMHPYNAPPWDEFRDVEPYVDSEGLRWVIRPTKVLRQEQTKVVPRPAVEVICLDDSAMRKEVLLKDESTYADAKLLSIGDIDEAIVNAVKETFEPLPTDFYQQ